MIQRLKTRLWSLLAGTKSSPVWRSGVGEKANDNNDERTGETALVGNAAGQGIQTRATSGKLEQLVRHCAHERGCQWWRAWSSCHVSSPCDLSKGMVSVMLNLGVDVKTRPLLRHHHLPQPCHPQSPLLPRLPPRSLSGVRQVSSEIHPTISARRGPNTLQLPLTIDPVARVAWLLLWPGEKSLLPPVAWTQQLQSTHQRKVTGKGKRKTAKLEACRGWKPH